MRTLHAARIPLAAATALIAGLGLTGCFFPNPVETIVDKVAEDNGVDLDTGDGDVRWEDESGSVHIGENVEMPSGFPSDLPVPDGTLAAVITMETGITLQFHEVDREEVGALVSALEAAGYENSVTDTGSAYMASLQTDSRVVSVIWDSSEDTGGYLIYGYTDR